MKKIVTFLLGIMFFTVGTWMVSADMKLTPKFIGNFKAYETKTYGDENFPINLMPTFSTDGNTYYLPLKENNIPFILSNGKKINVTTPYEFKSSPYWDCNPGKKLEYKLYCKLSENYKDQKSPVINWVSDYASFDEKLYYEYNFKNNEYDESNVESTHIVYDGKEFTLEGKYILYFSPNRKYAVGFGPNGFYELWFDGYQETQPEKEKEDDNIKKVQSTFEEQIHEKYNVDTNKALYETLYEVENKDIFTKNLAKVFEIYSMKKLDNLYSYILQNKSKYGKTEKVRYILDSFMAEYQRKKLDDAKIIGESHFWEIDGIFQIDDTGGEETPYLTNENIGYITINGKKMALRLDGDDWTYLRNKRFEGESTTESLRFSNIFNPTVFASNPERYKKEYIKEFYDFGFDAEIIRKN